LFEHARRYDDYLKSVEIPEPDSLFSRPDASVASRGRGSGLGRTEAPWQLADKLGISAELDDRSYARACYQRYVQRYLRCVKGVDDNVQRLVDYLRETGELEHTLIVYSSDQGFLLGEHDLMDKRWMYEESMRMPLIVHWPQAVPAGSVNTWMISNTDFAPTLLALAGREQTPAYMQGRSFAAALWGAPQPSDWRTSVYYRYWMHLAHRLNVPAHFGIRNERYKLIFFYGCTLSGRKQTPVAWEFYDLQNDPFEMHNLYAHPEYRERILQLKAELLELRANLGETDEKAPEIQAIIDVHWSDS
jgi:arylsulfatase A-like enzyme